MGRPLIQEFLLPAIEGRPHVLALHADEEQSLRCVSSSDETPRASARTHHARLVRTLLALEKHRVSRSTSLAFFRVRVWELYIPFCQHMMLIRRDSNTAVANMTSISCLPMTAADPRRKACAPGARPPQPSPAAAESPERHLSSRA